MVFVSKTFDQINHTLLSNGLRETSLPEQVIDTLGYILNNIVARLSEPFGDDHAGHWYIYERAGTQN